MEDSKWVCRNCRCYWRKHSLGWSLWDGDQIPCKACDNGPDFLRLLDRVETTPSPSDSLPPLPSADALSADDHRLLAMLRGEWNNEADGYWPAVDAMDEAARVIERLAAQVADVQARHTANHDAWLDEVVTLKRELAAAREDADMLDWLELCIRDGSHLSVFNDLIACVQNAHAIFGPGPSIRTILFNLMPPAARRGEGKEG